MQPFAAHFQMMRLNWNENNQIMRDRLDWKK